MSCFDCGGPEGDIDTVLTRQQWLLVFPEESGGVLCAPCINKRAARLPNVINLFVCIVFSEDYNDMIDHGVGVSCHPRRLSSLCPFCQENAT